MRHTDGAGTTLCAAKLRQDRFLMGWGFPEFEKRRYRIVCIVRLAPFRLLSLVLLFGDPPTMNSANEVEALWEEHCQYHRRKMQSEKNAPEN
jgi:hypothetical protein